ncbi:large subunit ribosomal protein L31e [Microbotryum lychnidis-dioicae p1A1 Lamole]|uniref:Large subunit ribosomal protein L31e n=2 Tax=Microbotryum TaxID=34416 RepID=U5H9X9_USTV1|nr:large subunit ribosomal protein L31e [Microbotryum lychnidis-dioicae p1A1 Lamole]SGZ25885.1 BQ5605_C024g09790 [Microbotryum silenes-dioicae]|eukprot:KDE05645.1 large subunit ribosomal protein L31e [Microbotryum lychnidis-dioicae p1A1 Lamole]
MVRTRQTKPERKQRSALTDVVAREYTIHLHTKVHGQGFKHRAPTAVKAVKEFARKAMGTKKVLLDVNLNAAIWGKGIKNVPHRIRVRCHRRRNDDEDAPKDEKLYTMVSFVPTKDFKGLQTSAVDADE